MSARRAFVLLSLGVLAAVSATASCSSVPAAARVGVDAPPENNFGAIQTGGIPSLGDFLGRRCGSLDCHGQVGRNLRIWGCEGMRLAPEAGVSGEGGAPAMAGGLPVPTVSGCSGMPGQGGTTADEYHATYRSLVGLEPTVMTVVWDGPPHGARPELLTFVRKARGTEAHKGGKLIEPGDDQDNCITSWLSGNVNLDACTVAYMAPSFPDASTE